MSYTYVLGGGVANTALVGYLSLPLTANTILSWPISFYDTVNVVARTMDIVPNQNGWVLTLPDARQTATGMSVLINNPSAFDFILHDNDGNLLQDVAAGTIRYIWLVDNTTPGGTWRVNPWGGGIASVTLVDVQPAAGSGVAIQSAGGPIVNAGVINLTMSPELVGLAEIPGSGYIVRVGAGDYENRTLTAPINSNIVLGNANGIAGNTTIALSATPSGLTSIEVGNLSLVGNTFASTNANGSINISPNGNGSINVATAAGNINLVSGLNVNIGALSYPQTDNAKVGYVPLSNGVNNLLMARVTAVNMIINGAFQVWNRGTSVNSSGAPIYGPDRWQLATTGGMAALAQRIQTGNNNYACSWGRNVGDATIGTVTLAQSMLITTCGGASSEGFVSYRFTAAAEAGFSAAGNTLRVYVIAGNGNANTSAIGAGFAGGAIIESSDVNFPLRNNIYDTFTQNNIIVPPGTTQLALVFSYLTTGVAGANDKVDLTNVQFNLGASASAFENLDEGIVRKQCEFYTFKDFAYVTGPAQNVGVNTGETTLIATKAGAVANPSTTITHPQMRAVPGITTFYNPAAANALARDITGGLDCGAPTLVSNTDKSFSVTVVGNAGSAIGNAIGFHYLRDAELY